MFLSVVCRRMMMSLHGIHISSCNSFFTAPIPPYFSFRPIVVNPINYHYGDDVNITCAVDFYPHPSDTLGWNFMVSYLEKIMLCIYQPSKVLSLQCSLSFSLSYFLTISLSLSLALALLLPSVWQWSCHYLFKRLN